MNQEFLQRHEVSFGANELTKQLMLRNCAAAFPSRRASPERETLIRVLEETFHHLSPLFCVFIQQPSPNTLLCLHTHTLTSIHSIQILLSISIILKMSVVSLLGVNVLNNPAKFGDSYQFEITFECLESLQKGD